MHSGVKFSVSKYWFEKDVEEGQFSIYTGLSTALKLCLQWENNFCCAFLISLFKTQLFYCLLTFPGAQIIYIQSIY